MATYFPDQPSQTSGRNAGIVRGSIFSPSSSLLCHVLVKFGQRGPSLDWILLISRHLTARQENDMKTGMKRYRRRALCILRQNQ